MRPRGDRGDDPLRVRRCGRWGAGGRSPSSAASWRQWVAIGAVANAVPFWLVAWGEKHVDSGIAAIAQSTVPLFTILLGLRFLPHEPLSRGQLLGFALGLIGVGVLAGGHPDGGWWGVAGTLAVVLSSLAYACGNVIGQRSVSGTPGPVLATGAMTAAAITLLPAAVLQTPTTMPDADAILSLLALAILGTALAQLVLYRMLNLYGARQREPRHLPHARLRARLRRPPAGRADHGGGARWAGADPRGRRARLGRAPPLVGAEDGRGGRAVSVTLRRATADDVPFLVGLLTDADVAPFLAAVRASTPEAVAAEIDRSEREPDAFGVLVVELDGEPAGTVTWERVNRRSRIASVSALAIAPRLRGRGVGVEAARALQRHLIRDVGFHRIQMEVYGFNERSLRHAERAGWVREGVRRKAYWRDGDWVDGVLFGLVEEDLGPS